MAGMTLVTGPAIEPLTVADVTAQLRIDATNQEPAPTDAPTGVLVFATPGNVNAGVHQYAVSFGTAEGETPPGPMSGPVTVVNPATAGQVALSGIDLGGTPVTFRKLWRTVANGSTLFLLATIPDNVTTTFTDNVADSGLGAQAPSVNTTSDPQLNGYIVAARQMFEGFTDRAVFTQTWNHIADTWPWDDGFFDLPANLQSVGPITYVDVTFTTQTVDPSTYVVSTPTGPRAPRGRVALAYAKVWPPPLVQKDVITVPIVIGFGTSRAQVPEDILIGMLLVIGTLYKNRQDQTIVRGTADKLPRNAERMWKRYQAPPMTRQAVVW